MPDTTVTSSSTPVSPMDTPPVECVGVALHEWTLHVEDGAASVGTLPCGPGCPADRWSLLPEADLYVEEIPVRVGVGTECPAYDLDDDGMVAGGPTPMKGYESGSHYIAHGTRCDCNWWPVAAALTEPAIGEPA